MGAYGRYRGVVYQDRWIECTDEWVRVRGYYFPWGTKRIRYSRIKSVQRVAMSTYRGQTRLWGTANPRYWTSLDPQRGSKTEALVLNLGGFVRPFLTPDSCDAVEEAIREHAPLQPAPTDGPVQAPVI